MSIMRLLLGRRQFLFAFLGSALTLIFGGASRAFEMIFQTGVAKASENQETGVKKPLRGIVVYYSATGNTAQVAEAVWRGMNSVIPCDVAPVKMIKPEDMAKYDIMALGAPNWYMRVPANVLSFTHDMPRMDGKHCILFGTHGSGGPGMFWIMSRNILKKGMSIIGWSDWFGSDFLTPHSCVPDGEWGHPDSIDLAEAEAFGRHMVLNSQKIYNGQRDLLPDEVPSPDMGGTSLFSPSGSGNKLSFAGGAANAKPKFNFTNCVYPRCNRCIENCPAHAIDFSLVAPFGLLAPKSMDASPLVLKEACQQCGGLCERVCNYNAIAYVGSAGARVFQNIDMTKCTYPKCSACMDVCPQDAIDVSKNPPIILNCCENESLCFGVCPENAIATTLTSMHIDEGTGGREGMEMPGEQGGRGEMEPPGQEAMMAGGPGGSGEPVQMPGGDMGGYSARFRSLVIDECKLGTVNDINVYPRVPINKDLWPYHMNEA